VDFFIIADLTNFPGFKSNKTSKADSQLCHNAALNPNKRITN